MASRHPEADWIRAVVEDFDGRLVSYAFRLTGDLESARDVVQDVFLKLCCQRRTDIQSHLAEWLYTVCRNLCLNARRKESRKESLSAAGTAELASTMETAELIYEQDESLEAIERALADLSDNQREVIRLKFEHGLSYREISVITGLSVGNVGYLLTIGLKRIRQRLSPDDCLAHTQCEKTT